MRSALTLSRRAVLAAKAALCGLVAVPGIARASSPASLPETMAAPAAAGPAVAPARWTTATATELHRHMGQRFRLTTADGRSLAMRLTKLETMSAPDTARPAHLKRAAGVVAVFESPDVAPLAESGPQTCTVQHPMIGTATLFAGITPHRDGRTTIDIVLN